MHLSSGPSSPFLICTAPVWHLRHDLKYSISCSFTYFSLFWSTNCCFAQASPVYNRAGHHGEGIPVKSSLLVWTEPGRKGTQAQPAVDYGIRTMSMTWMTPFEASMSVMITWASSMKTLPSITRTTTSDPSSVVAVVRFTTSSASTVPPTTW